MANSTNTFKCRLDTYWQDQEIIYDFHAQLQGTGSRSEVFRLWLIDHIGYVKVWNEAGKRHRPAPAIPLRLRLLNQMLHLMNYRQSQNLQQFSIFWNDYFGQIM